MDEANTAQPLSSFSAQGRNPDAAIVAHHGIQDMALSIYQDADLAGKLRRKSGELPGEVLIDDGFRTEPALTQLLQSGQLGRF